MVTEVKKTELEELRESFKTAKMALMANFSGVTVEDVDVLRRNLRASNTRLKVVKNTLARLAVKDTPIEGADKMFKGPVTVAFGYSDDIGASAKTFLDFAKAKADNLKIIGGVVEGSVLTAEQVRKLGDMPTKPVAQAMFLGLLQSPARNFLGVMEAAARKFLYALNAVAEKKQEGGQA
ncbi:MAG: 50S ribosomal protein L10 [Nitrospinae bacterium]|nr:50S ribosomal protein L10 [Nitrospinota bacterium]